MAMFNKVSKNKFSELQNILREPMRLCRWTGFFPVDGLSESTISKISVLHLTYYIYSFTFLMTRASVMCLLAANVYRAAQEPLFVIEHVPASEYTLESAMKLPMVIGQCFGLNPVIGIFDIDATKIKFKLCSARCLYTIFSILGQAAMLFLSILKYLKDTDTSLSSNTTLAFYSSNFVTTVLFLRIASKWPRLSLQISMTEATSPNMDNSLLKKCNMTCILVLVLALVEHFLSDLSGLAAVIDCEPEKNIYEAFVKHSFPWVYAFVPYNHFIGFLTQNMPQHFWRTVREDYNRAASLVRRVDEAIGAIIFISFANNLFFICLQLYNTLKDGIKATPLCRAQDIRPLYGYEQATYFMYSFIFLVMRSLAVSLIAAEVYAASRKPATSLYDVSYNSYSVEIQRFLDQVHGDTVALSGLQFFNIKKGLVLSIAGTIVTYELVLLQFTGVTPTSSPPVADFLS
ncbi:putative gustatory receptor 64e [Papilio machaon]|uniref:Putative gustatory receptor 64e n=1 Tax=Papilio machaon TaxID=76193 RepID=A0A194RIY6_PAPMA|nr:putative gustatory receptor 64e [Papilio machaon]